MGRFIAPVLVALLSACATMHGPRTITVSATEIESQVQADLGGVLEAFGGLDARRPEVSLMPLSGRLLLEWKFTLRTVLPVRPWVSPSNFPASRR